MKAEKTVTRVEDRLTPAHPVRVWTYAFERLDGSVPWATSMPASCCGEVRYCHGYPEIPPHDHEHYEFELILEGSALHSTSEGEIRLRPGDAHIMAPGEIHSFSEVDGIYIAHCAYIGEWLTSDIRELLAIDGLAPLFLPTLLARHARRVRVPQWRLDPARFSKCVLEMRDIAAECAEPAPCLEYLRWSIKKLMYHLYCAYRETDCSLLLPIRNDIREAVIAIERHVAEGDPLDASELAHSLKMSPAVFSRSFKQSTGYSPMQYFQRRRIERASWLLRDASRSITEIAYELGYADASYFTRMFRKHYGQTPTEFAERFQAVPPA